MSLIGTCESLAVPQLRGADDQLLNRLCACAPDFESVTAGSGKIFLQRYLPSSHWPDRKSRSAAISLPRRCMLLALPKQGLTAHRRADSGSNSSISPLASRLLPPGTATGRWTLSKGRNQRGRN